MPKRATSKPLFSLSPVEFRDSAIAGRGVFARRAFAPGEVVTPYAPRQQRLPADHPMAVAAAETKLTLLSERQWVIVPDTTVPGGWLCNHSCAPNAALYSSGDGRIQSIRAIAAGEEVTIFYGWVTWNEPARDPCRCGASGCRGFINFDVTDQDAKHFEAKTPEGEALQRRIDEYAEYLCSISQEQVLDTVLGMLESRRHAGRR